MGALFVLISLVGCGGGGGTSSPPVVDLWRIDDPSSLVGVWQDVTYGDTMTVKDDGTWSYQDGETQATGTYQIMDGKPAFTIGTTTNPAEFTVGEVLRPDLQVLYDNRILFQRPEGDNPRELFVYQRSGSSFSFQDSNLVGTWEPSDPSESYILEVEANGSYSIIYDDGIEQGNWGAQSGLILYEVISTTSLEGGIQGETGFLRYSFTNSYQTIRVTDEYGDVFTLNRPASVALGDLPGTWIEIENDYTLTISDDGSWTWVAGAEHAGGHLSLLEDGTLRFWVTSSSDPEMTDFSRQSSLTHNGNILIFDDADGEEAYRRQGSAINFSDTAVVGLWEKDWGGGEVEQIDIADDGTFTYTEILGTISVYEESGVYLAMDGFALYRVTVSSEGAYDSYVFYTVSGDTLSIRYNSGDTVEYTRQELAAPQ